MSHRTLDELLAEARAKIERLEPAADWSAAQDGALIVDTRADRSPGVAPGSLHVPLSVLQWRLAPESAWRNPHAGSLETRLILICEHGESSSLAAASVLELGFAQVGDVIGRSLAGSGFAGQPSPAPGDGLPGMDSPA